MDWTAGYVTEIDYIYGYNRELGPGLLRLACLSAGVAPPAGSPLRYLELGYGLGLSLNIHAAAVLGEFWGTDFNPSHVAHARALADACGSGGSAGIRYQRLAWHLVVDIGREQAGGGRSHPAKVVRRRHRLH